MIRRLTLGRLALATLIVAYLLIIIGGLVSATGSGLGCGPEWPFCNGRAIPIFDNPQVILEYSHRLVAGLAIIFVTLTAIQAFREKGDHTAMYRGAALTAVLVIGFEALLGAVTVFYHLPPAVTTVHLGTAMAFFGLVTFIFTVYTASHSPGFQKAARRVSPLFRVLSVITAVVLYGTILMGAYMKLTGAGLACTGFPLCNGQLWPAMVGPALVHWTHRLLAFSTGALIVVLAYVAMRSQRKSVLVHFSHTALSLVIVQITLGAITVASQLNPFVSTLHLATATALFGVVVATAGVAFTLPATESSGRLADRVEVAN